MKDRLLFATIGLLVGIVVMQWTMPASRAEYVPTAVGIVAAANPTNGSSTYVLDQNGAVWRFSDGPVEMCWQQDQSQPPLPVPVSDLKFYGGQVLVTKADHFWRIDIHGDGQWHNCGPWPGAPLATDQSTWGKVKAKFTGKGDKP